MRTILSLAFLIILASSCKKDHIDKHQFYGTWEIQSSTSYSPGGGPVQHYSPGSGTYIELRSDGTFNRYKDNQLQESATFGLSKKPVTGCKFYDLKEYWAINYQNGSHEWIQFNNDTLTISTPPCWMDGGSTEYVRVNK